MCVAKYSKRLIASRLIYLVACVLGATLSSALSASVTVVHVSPEDDLPALIQQAEPKTEFRLSEGLYKVNLLIDKTVAITGSRRSVIDAGGNDDAIRIHAPNVRIAGLTIQNWGDDLTAMNAGIFLGQGGDHSVIANNSLQGNTTGIWVEKTTGVSVEGNLVEGNLDVRSTDRGNGIHLSNARNTLVKNNEVWHARDGLYIINSQFNTLSDNFLHHVRYGVHYMYSHSNTVRNNRTLQTRAGYALMQSRLLTVVDNTAEKSEDYGILLNFITRSTLSNNQIIEVKADPAEQIEGASGKGFFIYNSVHNELTGNHISQADIGIHLTAGSEDNVISRNIFMNNQTQVKYVATRKQEWSQNGTGNYWDNYLGWDLNHDGRGDHYFEPNDNMDRLLWTYPQARLLMDSPAILLLRLIQKQFPVLRSPGVRDSYPLMKGNTVSIKAQRSSP